MYMTVWDWVVLCIIVSLLTVLFGFIGYSAIGSGANLEYVKIHADEVAKEDRLKIVAYEGYKRGFYGARVYYQFERIPANGILYKGYYQKRPYTDEIHLHAFTAIDAIKPVRGQ